MQSDVKKCGIDHKKPSRLQARNLEGFNQITNNSLID